MNDLKHVKSPYGNGTAGRKIAKILLNIKIDDKLKKRCLLTNENIKNNFRIY